MRSDAKLTLLLAVAVSICLIFGCGKDDKSTSPDNTVPSVSVTVGPHQPAFPALAAAYDPDLKWLLIGFDQGQIGQYPIAFISVTDADSVVVGTPKECSSLNIYIDSTMQFICGSMAQNDSAVSEVIFSRLELRQYGRVSGDVTGMAEKQDHPEEGLFPLQIQFRNIPVIM